MSTQSTSLTGRMTSNRQFRPLPFDFIFSEKRKFNLRCRLLHVVSDSLHRQMKSNKKKKERQSSFLSYYPFEFLEVSRVHLLESIFLSV